MLFLPLKLTYVCYEPKADLYVSNKFELKVQNKAQTQYSKKESNLDVKRRNKQCDATVSTAENLWYALDISVSISTVVLSPSTASSSSNWKFQF